MTKETAKKIQDLVRELRQEAYFEGHDSALFDFSKAHHTVEKRKDMLNHKRLKEQISSEIEHIIKTECEVKV